MNVLLVVTGASHMLSETVRAFRDCSAKVDVAFTVSGEMVSKSLGFEKNFKAFAKNVFYESAVGASPMSIVRLSMYDRIIVAPASANTCAKIAHGIADSLASNIVAQALKRNVEVFVLPTDTAPNVKSAWKDGFVEIKCRKIDLENMQRLKEQGEVKILESPKKISEIIRPDSS
ncbi:MAG TPA: hypothetical protein ENN13_00180 [Candidatus Altiarchaeales archaeon]|nr:hypothetical protein [Candidatus Altiarchaeales archaeon]